MIVEAELALMAAAVGLYLYDSALLLYHNEGVLTPRGAAWAVRFGSKIRLRGKELLVPSPLSLHRPVFRLMWQFEDSGRAADARWSERRALFEPLAPFVWAMGLAVFVLLPLGLFSRLGERMLLAAIALLYLNIVAALVLLAVKRASFGLSRKRLAALAFESLVCSPFALNLVRRISAEMPVDEDLVSAARRLQKPGDWQRARREFIARIDEELLGEDDDSERARALQAHRRKLLAEGEPGP